MTPLVKSLTRPNWERIPEKHVYYYRNPKQKGSVYLLSFLFAFDLPDDEYFFAYSYPYTNSMLRQFLYFISLKHLPYFSRETICKTVQNRDVELLTITSPENLHKKVFSIDIGNLLRREEKLYLLLQEYTLESLQLHTFVMESFHF
jgi:hypothetical protein